MSKILIIYGSSTGNTENVAESVKEALGSCGLEVRLKNVKDTQPGELKEYETIILGSSTWGMGELQDDFVAFEQGLKKINLDRKKGAVFGCGDSIMYPDTFCEAVHILEKRLKSCGARIIADSLKIDGEIESSQKRAQDWAKKIAQILRYC